MDFRADSAIRAFRLHATIFTHVKWRCNDSYLRKLLKAFSQDLLLCSLSTEVHSKLFDVHKIFILRTELGCALSLKLVWCESGFLRDILSET
jgi:hypothetical protein